jgi:ligand-binding sensor domain-containing protein
MQRKLFHFNSLWLPVKIHGFGLLVLVFQHCYINTCIAQEPKTRINIQLLGPEQGLPSRNTRCLSQDGRGFMWVGTGQDLWRYDGYTFQNFTAMLTRSIGSSTLINVIRTGPGGKIWVAHNNGVSIVDPVNFTCITIDPSHYIQEIATKQNLEIFFDKHDNAWVAIPGDRLVKINKNYIPVDLYTPPTDPSSPVSVESFVAKLFCDRQKTMYAYMKGNYLAIINEKAKPGGRIDLIGAELPAGNFQVIGVVQSDPDGVAVYYQRQGSKKSYVRKYSFEKQAFGPLTEAIAPVVAQNVYPGRKGYTWYRSEKEVGFLNQKSGKFTAFTTQLRQKSGAESYFFEAFLSSDDVFWISCVDGLFKITLTEEVFRRYLSVPLEKPGDIGSSIRGITQDSSGKVWVSSYGFNTEGKTYLLHQIDQQAGTVRHLELRRPEKMSEPYVLPYKLLFGKDYIYAITDGIQFLRINPASLLYQAIEFPFVSGRGFTSVYRLNDHTFWMGTWGGMGIIDTRNMRPILLNDLAGPYIKNERVNYFMPWAQNRILVSTTNGLYVLNQDATIECHFGQEKTDKIKLPALQIFHTTWHENALWAASGQGLIRIDTTLKEVRLFTIQDGLPDNNIYAALPDQRGNLWLSTNKGLSRFNPRTQKFYNYGLADGLPHLEFNHGSYLSSRDGTLYFGGLNGVVAFQPDKLDDSKQKEHVLQLISYSKYDAARNRTDTVTNYQLGRQIVFNPGDRLFAFSFMSPDYHNSALNRFRYKLEGWDDDNGWQMFGNGNKLYFNSLPPGTYNLRVQVSVAGADWSSREWKASVKVIAPWYKSIWFFILCLLAVCLVLYLFYRYRLKQILHIQQIRNGISADMHDEIGSTLSSITFYSQALLMQMEKTEHQEVVLKIKENAQQVQEGLSDIVWSIKASNDEIEDVFARMFRFGSGLAESRGIAFGFDSDAQLQSMKLDMQSRKNLYLIFKEAINNAAKHSHCSTIEVKIKHESGNISMVIKDDGKGFERPNSKQGNGLANMHQRATQMKGKLSIQSRNSGGTVITLTF